MKLYILKSIAILIIPVKRYCPSQLVEFSAVSHWDAENYGTRLCRMVPIERGRLDRWISIAAPTILFSV